MRYGFFSAKNLTRLAVFTALSVVLYFFVKIPLPIFPSFLELQISDMPALIAGFAGGPLSGAVVIIVRTLIKLPFSHTACVGELADLIIGLGFVLSSAFFYKKFRTLKGALIGLIIGTFSTTAVAVLCNYLFLIPFYATLMPMEAILGMVQVVHKSATMETFYLYYLLFAVLPFNLLRGAICGVITFIVYKSTNRIFDRMFDSSKNKKKVPQTVARGTLDQGDSNTEIADEEIAGSLNVESNNTKQKEIE